MKDTLAKFTLGLVTSVSLSAMTVFLTSSKSNDNNNDTNNDNNYTLYTPHYHGGIVTHPHINNDTFKSDNKNLPAYKNELINKNVKEDNVYDLYQNCLIISYLDDIALNSDYTYKKKKCSFSYDKYDKMSSYFEI